MRIGDSLRIRRRRAGVDGACCGANDFFNGLLAGRRARAHDSRGGATTQSSAVPAVRWRCRSPSASNATSWYATRGAILIASDRARSTRQPWAMTWSEPSTGASEPAPADIGSKQTTRPPSRTTPDPLESDCERPRKQASACRRPINLRSATARGVEPATQTDSAPSRDTDSACTDSRTSANTRTPAAAASSHTAAPIERSASRTRATSPASSRASSKTAR